MRKAKKPFIRYVRLEYNEDIAIGLAETLAELGFDFYECPLEDRGIFISNVPLTEGWLAKNCGKFDLELDGWKPSDKDAVLEDYAW